MRQLLLLCLLGLAHVASAQLDYYVRFPDDILATNCNAQSLYTEPQVYNTQGADVKIEYYDEIIDVVPDACYIISRVWVVKSPDYDPALPCIYVPNPRPFALPNNPLNFVGPTVSPAGTPDPWSPSLMKVSPSDPAPTDYSTFWSSTANCYQYTQIIKIIDIVNPVFSCIPTEALFADDGTNDTLLWNAPYWFDPLTNSPNWSEAPVNLSTQATDACSGSNLNFRALLFLDLDGNGTFETVVDSRNPPEPGQVNFGNAGNPGFLGGTPRDFDHRPVAATQKYRFAIQKTTSGSTLNLALGWNTQTSPGTWVQPQLPPGRHKIKWIVEDGCGNEAVCETLFRVEKGSTAGIFKTLRGKLYWDKNENCQADSGDTFPISWQQMALHTFSSGQIIHTTILTLSADGRFQFSVPVGQYVLQPLIPGDQFVNICTSSTFSVQSVGDTATLELPMQALYYCPLLRTDISTTGLHPCAESTYTLRYENVGSITATDAYLRLYLDRFLSLVGSSLPAEPEGQGRWRIALGDLPPFQVGSLSVVARLTCDSIFPGQSFCAEAHIFPDSSCRPIPHNVPPSGYYADLLNIDGLCEADSVRFTIQNPSAQHFAYKSYKLIRDAQEVRSGTLNILPSGIWQIAAPADGSTWRLQVSVPPALPLPGQVLLTQSLAIEACGRNSAGGVSTGFVSFFAEGDAAPFYSTDCQQSSEHFLPFDKHGYPLGYGPDHLIEQGQPIDYIIRFQNLTTDTLRSAVVTDTLHPWLSAFTVQPGASSHPYTFRQLGANAVQFVFDDILLPPWATNEAASHGFVKFRAEQPIGTYAPIGTLITNSASVRLGEGSPVITPTTRHRVGKNFVTSAVRELTGLPALRVSPNPAT
ncbi:MAG TPA: hypothetical protein PKD78_01635, partial [Saprospiraceae bacterium]|nr:hypothetical protein [Saprospiraceae bacterium]